MCIWILRDVYRQAGQRKCMLLFTSIFFLKGITDGRQNKDDDNKVEKKELDWNGKGGSKEKTTNFGFDYDVRDERVVNNNTFSKIKSRQGLSNFDVF